MQRLAERAANATKQIEVLVRTIQADTNEAVVSMERSTTDVVGGALLAENAGAALEEIEQVSNQIASLVQNISASSPPAGGRSQSIARNMQVLREISSQTAESTTATSSVDRQARRARRAAAQVRRRLPAARLRRNRASPASTRCCGPTSADAARTRTPRERHRLTRGTSTAAVSTGPLTLASVDEAHASLQVIAREIAAELNEARVALEAFVERPEDRGALHRFAAHVHLARGALRLAEIYGGGAARRGNGARRALRRRCIPARARRTPTASRR